jgi:hypothetical protein
MGLLETKAELEKQLEDALKAEETELNEPEELEDQPIEIEETSPEETTPEEPKPEEKPSEPEKLDDSGYARLRREKAAAEKLARQAEEETRQLREEMSRLRQQPTPQEQSQPEPQAIPELKEIIETHRMTQAEREFMGYENNFKSKTPDYGDISAQYSKAIFDSIRIQNPRLSSQEIAERTKKTILIKAGQYLSQGFDPIEELYEEAKTLGFAALPKEETVEEESSKKPDLNKVSANRQRNAGMAGAKGRGGGGQLTRQAAADLTAAEWVKLPKAEKDRLLSGG